MNNNLFMFQKIIITQWPSLEASSRFYLSKLIMTQKLNKLQREKKSMNLFTVSLMITSPIESKQMIIL